jgi:hypothetical protein
MTLPVRFVRIVLMGALLAGVGLLVYVLLVKSITTTLMEPHVSILV